MYDNESLLSLVLDTISEGLCVFHNTPEFPFMRFTVWNKKMVELTGYTIDEINHSGWNRILDSDPSVQEKVVKRVEAIISGNGLRDEEWEIRRSDGRKKYLKIFTSIVSAETAATHRMAIIKDITDAHESEKKLLDNEKYLRIALKAAYVILFEWDIRSNKVRRFFSAEPALKATGDKSETFDSFLDVVHPDDHEQFRANVTKALEHDSGNYRNEFRIIRPDGEVAWISECGQVEYDEEGRPTRLVGIAQDITKIKRAERLALTRLEEIESLYQNAPVGLCVLDRELRFIRINERLAEANGFSVAYHIGKKVSEVLPELTKVTESAMHRLLETGEPLRDIEIVGETPAKPGIRQTWLEQWFPVTDARGQVIAVNVVAEEITSRRHDEAKLRHQSELLQSIFDNIPILLVKWDPNFKQFTLNSHAEEVLRISTAEANAGDFMTMVYPDPDYRRQVYEYMKSLKHGWREWVATTSDGELVPVDWANIQLTDNSMIGIGVDLRQRKKAEQERDQLIENLEKAIQDLQGFTYTVSHDLRSPIRHLSSYAYLLEKKSGPLLDEKCHNYVRTISNASIKLGILVDELLEFSRMGHTNMEKSRVNLDILVRDIVRDYKQEIKNRNIEWLVQPLPEVSGDSSMLQLVFSNLVGNAVKFTGKRENAVIEIGSFEDGENFILYVKDNGIGFDMKYYDKLFGVFHRLHTAEEFEGTGIGLANVRQIVQRHGGLVWADGKINEGATFSVSLPKN
ncbi:MAG: PAS domain S-box protein [Desulfobulbaceae bacterium]|nr:PAS domain S-box protein [Desulfobulbaceae bacterium]